MAKRTTKTRARASTASRRAAIGQPRVISKQTIISIIRHMLDPNGNRPVVWDLAIGKYIKGGPPAVRAFFAPLNRAFKVFGLNLKPGDLAHVQTVADVVTVVADWLRSHGYQVIL
jgi:hypothetical protein